MFFRINNNHGVLNSTGNITFRCTTKSHISNEIGNNPHFLLLFLFLHEAHAIGISFRYCICCLRVKVLQILQSGGGFNIDFARHRNSHDSIAIEVCTRQPFCNLSVDTDSVLYRTKIPTARQVLIVDRHKWNFKGTCMRKTNQCKLSSIRICRAIAFSLTDFGQRQNDLRCLTRER